MKSELCILGAGLSGLSFAYHFPGISTIYEARNQVGGTASSIHWDGFTFDYGIHASFTKDEYVRELFSQAVRGQQITQNVLNANYYRGLWIGHPAICHLSDFPPEINRDALISFIESREGENVAISNYRQWCELVQGKYFAENFTHVYTRKFWTVEPEELTYQWAGERVAKPSLKRVVEGSLGLQQDTGYYYTQFRYPQQGGYGAYSNFWHSARERIKLHLNYQVTRIDLSNKTLSFANRDDASFSDTLISSLPLPEFVLLVRDAPEEVKVAANKLRYTSIAFINIALDRPIDLPYHWFYVYDEDILATRVNIYSNISPGNAPANCTALQAEVPYSKSRPLPTENVVERVVEDFIECGIIARSSVLKAWQVKVKYGYVIFDRDRAEAVHTIHAWMKQQHVIPIGRFGLWQYLWSDRAVKSGKIIANSLSKVN